MIIFDLTCENGHAFEGWFNSSAGFDEQLREGLLVCASCGSTAIRRVPSAPHLGKPADRSIEKATGVAPGTIARAAAQGEPGNSQAEVTPAGLEQIYQHLMATIAARCEDVGKEFADEARKIHYLETPARAIRGQASDDEYEALRDEGIDVVRLPVVSKH